MELEIKETGKAPIELFSAIPAAFQKHHISNAVPLFAKGSSFLIMMQRFDGDGFAAWYSRYFMQLPAILEARAGMPVLELRISLKNCIKGNWEKITNAELPANFFQMGYVPYVATKAIFETPGEYETFDIHFDLSFLQSIGLDYKTLEQFINAATKNQPTELSKRLHPCPSFMLDTIDHILHNSYSPAGKLNALNHNIIMILIAALEEVGRDEIAKLTLSNNDIDALYHIRSMIDNEFPVYPGNKKMVYRAATNLFKLHNGFKHLFGMNPYAYFLEKRFIAAKKLLREGHKIETVRQELDYASAAAFVREFKRRFGYTPGEYQKYGEIKF